MHKSDAMILQPAQLPEPDEGWAVIAAPEARGEIGTILAVHCVRTPRSSAQLMIQTCSGK